MNSPISLYQAIAEMRRLTKQNKPFSFVYMSYSITTGKSNGPVHVKKAVLRPQATEKQNQYHDSMLNYFDIEHQANKKLWQPLLMELNGTKIKLD